MKVVTGKKIFWIVFFAIVLIACSVGGGALVRMLDTSSLENELEVSLYLGEETEVDLSDYISEGSTANNIPAFRNDSDGVISVEGNKVKAVGVGSGEMFAQVGRDGREITIVYEVSFRDEALETFIMAGQDRMEEDAIAEITSLDLSGWDDIRDIRDIYALANLTEIDLTDTGIDVGYSVLEMDEGVLNVYNLPQLKTVRTTAIDTVELSQGESINLLATGVQNNIADYYRGVADLADLTFTTTGSSVSLNGSIAQAVSSGVSVVNVYCGGVQCESITVRVS